MEIECSGPNKICVNVTTLKNVETFQKAVWHGRHYWHNNKRSYGMQRPWDASNSGTSVFPLTPGRESPHIKNNKLRDYRKHGTHYVYAAISISGPLSRPLAWVGVRVDATRTWFFFHQIRPDRRASRYYNVGGRCPTRIAFLSYIRLGMWRNNLIFSENGA